VSLGLWLTLLLSVVLETQTIDEGTLSLAVASCDQVLPEHCSAAPAQADYHVLLRADPALSEVQIEVHRGGPEGPLTASRKLALDLAAPREERARTLGLVIAAQVMGHTPEEPPPLAPPPPPPKAVTQRTPRAFALDLGALAGAALDRGSPRLGGMVRGSWRRSTLGLLASVRGAARPGDDPRLWWLGFTAGVLAHGEHGRVAAEARLEFVAQRLRVVAEDPDRRERESAFRVGAQLGADGLLRLAGPYWLFVGGEAALLGPPVRLTLRGHDQGSEPRVSWGALFGFRRAW
jgi:hypothetical protein